MSRIEERADVDGDRAEVKFRFVATLIVATVMAALTALVLSYPVLAPDRTGPHGAAAVQHVFSAG